MAPYFLTLATLCFAAAMLHSSTKNVAEAMSGNRLSLEQLSSHRNQYFLNEFCDLESKTLRAAKKLKHDDTYSLFLVNKVNENSARIQKTHQRPPSSISFGFGQSLSAAVSQEQQQPVKKQLNCSINVVAPKLHGLLMTIHSIDLPANLTKLSVTLYLNETHSQSITVGSSEQTSHLLLTQPGNSKIGINLQSFQPIDWSTLAFDILFTVYKKGNSTGCPNNKWFDCGENICVPASLVCDGNKNCPNGNDEMVSYLCYSPLFLSIATSVGLALVFIILVVVIVVYVSRRKQNELAASLEDDAQNDDDDVNCDYDHCTYPTAYGFSSDAAIDSSRVDLTLDTANVNNGYLTNNLYAGGFENPVWTGNSRLKPRQIHASLNVNSLQRSLLSSRHHNQGARSVKRTTFKQ